VNPFGNEKTLPGGTLREPPPNLARADVIVVSRSDQTDRLSELRERLRSLNPSAPVVLGVHAPDGLLVHPTGDSLDLTILKNARVLAVSSIGNPWSFAESVRTLGAEVLDHLRFPNHAKYRHRALSRIADAARQLRCEAIITTEKDAVRLPSHIDCGCPIWVLSIRFRIVEGAASFLDLLDALVTRAKTMGMNGQA
ncbi:MAG TPA: tetraacyldisaccharide 4'-kinase, partial [Candidatus Latescibacteria bacterium]|nr:tetraacyldisaccharide 4'-kinase [Candidatus Latescibacterota bacterium]